MSQKKSKIKIGISLILLAALGSALGQLLLKVGTDVTGIGSILLFTSGFLLSAIGAVLMMISFKFGEISILQPIMSFSYVYSFFFGLIFLSEPITITKVIGTIFIILGAIVMSLPEKRKEKPNV